MSGWGGGGIWSRGGGLRRRIGKGGRGDRNEVADRRGGSLASSGLLEK